MMMSLWKVKTIFPRRIEMEEVTREQDPNICVVCKKFAFGGIVLTTKELAECDSFSEILSEGTICLNCYFNSKGNGGDDATEDEAPSFSED
jgi:hypothetical protein